jgi:hypothetical protein
MIIWNSKAPGVETVQFTVHFEPRTVRELFIKWKFPAKRFDVLGLYEG